MNAEIAILIVNGGLDPTQGRWLDSYVLPRYTPEERQRLTAYFTDDVAQTVELCPELDLRLWHDFVPS